MKTARTVGCLCLYHRYTAYSAPLKAIFILLLLLLLLYVVIYLYYTGNVYTHTHTCTCTYIYTYNICMIQTRNNNNNTYMLTLIEHNDSVGSRFRGKILNQIFIKRSKSIFRFPHSRVRTEGVDVKWGVPLVSESSNNLAEFSIYSNLEN